MLKGLLGLLFAMTLSILAIPVFSQTVSPLVTSSAGKDAATCKQDIMTTKTVMTPAALTEIRSILHSRVAQHVQISKTADVLRADSCVEAIVKSGESSLEDLAKALVENLSVPGMDVTEETISQFLGYVLLEN